MSFAIAPLLSRALAQYAAEIKTNVDKYLEVAFQKFMDLWLEHIGTLHKCYNYYLKHHEMRKIPPQPTPEPPLEVIYEFFHPQHPPAPAAVNLPVPLQCYDVGAALRVMDPSVAPESPSVSAVPSGHWQTTHLNEVRGGPQRRPSGPHAPINTTTNFNLFGCAGHQDED